MINFETNKDNKEYLNINVKYSIPLLYSLSYEEKIPEEIIEEASKIYSSIYSYEKENKTGYISEIAIRKTSKLGTFLLENTDMKNIIDEDKVVSYDKIVNAFNIAMFEGNGIASHIRPLFQGQISGTTEQLGLMYPKELLTYILENPSFEAYLKKFNGEYEEPIVYTVYENGEYSQRQLQKNQNDQKNGPKYIK